MSRGRALGPGCLRKRNGAYVLDWTDATGARRRQSLGSNKGVAERRRMELLSGGDQLVPDWFFRGEWVRGEHVTARRDEPLPAVSAIVSSRRHCLA